MTKRPRILVTRRLPIGVESALQHRFDVSLASRDEPTDASFLQRALGEFDGVLCTLTDRFTAEVLAAYPIRTRILANYGAGVDHIDLAAAAAHEIVVTNTPGVLTDATADITMTLILMACRRAGEGERELRGGAWRGWHPTHLVGNQVTGKTLGLIGTGRIARAVARRAHHGFGMKVLCFNPNPPDATSLLPVGAELAASLDLLLGVSDIVSIHCPSMPATRRMMNADRTARMKPGAVLINTARGDIIDDDAIISALQSGQLGAIGLDVYRNEPDLDQRYLSFENAVLLPHLGSATRETRDAMGFKAIASLTAFFGGTEVPDRVST